MFSFTHLHIHLGKLYLPRHYNLVITHCCWDLRRKEQERSEKTRSQVNSIDRDSNVTAGSQGILEHEQNEH